MLADLFERPWEWDFFQALREIERTHPAHPRLGTSTSLRGDPVRFGQAISLAFATSTLAANRIGAAPDQAAGEQRASSLRKLLVRFTGLTGPNGPMPMVFTELVRNRLTGVDDPDFPRTVFGEEAGRPQAARRDPALAEFLDIFHHRLICLFYRAWSLANQAVDYDRQGMAGDEPYFARWLASLFGHGLAEYEGLDNIPTWQKIAFAGHLAAPTRHLSGLEGVLRAAFAAPIEVVPLAGQWVNVPAQERCRLGTAPGTGTLGVSCLVGARIWDRQQKFTVRLGPVPYREFVSFLPGGACHRTLRDWVNLYTRLEYDWEVAIVLRRDEVPRPQLGHSGRLGRNAWLSSAPFAHDPDDFRLRSAAN